MEIRRVHPLEAEQLTSIAQESKRYWKYPEESLAAWADALTITPDFIFWNEVFAAVDADAMLGFYALSSKRRKFNLEHLWIRPAHIGEGVGSRLLKHAVDFAVESRAEIIEIVSDPNAEDFYRKMGARRVGEEITRIEGVKRVLPRLRIEVGNLEKSGI